MRALTSLLLAGVVGLGGLPLTSGTASANGYGGWRGRDYYRDYVRPGPGYYYGYGPRAYYRRPFAPRVYRSVPLGYYGAPTYFYGPPVVPPLVPPAVYGAPGFYGIPPVSYGVRPGPGVGLFSGPGFFGVPPGPGLGVFGGPGLHGIPAGPGVGLFGGAGGIAAGPGVGLFGR